MSGCANAGQALSRGLKLYTARTSLPLPFLYQTPTLRRYYSALQELAKENAAKAEPSNQPKRPDREPTSTSAHRPKPEYQDYVPFETSLVAEPTESQYIVEGETLTGTERNAFAQLEALGDAPIVRPAAKETRSIAEQYASLDDILNEALVVVEARDARDEARQQKASTEKVKKQRAKTSPSKSANADPPGVAEKTPKPASEKAALSAERVRTVQAIHRAQTDTALWSVLETKVFSPIAALTLDSTTPTTPTGLAMSLERRRFYMRQFPKFLVLAASYLRTAFPTSNMLLSLLPRIKQLGPSAHSLAATPDLYNQLLAYHYKKYLDLDTCCELLQEMEDAVIEWNDTTLFILNYMLDQRREGLTRGGPGTTPTKWLFKTEWYRKGWVGLVGWRDRVEKDLLAQKRREQMKGVVVGKQGDDKGGEEREVGVVRHEQAQHVRKERARTRPLINKVGVE
ncbi:hypothetical protein E4T39_05969 [Aureobasidium subglaciale]|nr:hypothetical protein E4T39_05969 [Aureobasidium subglaciale]